MNKTHSIFRLTASGCMALATLVIIFSNGCKKNNDAKEEFTAYSGSAIFCTNNGYGFFTNNPLSFSFYINQKIQTGIPQPGDNDQFYWNFGDGTTSTLHTPQHIYPIAGTYTVSLTINGYDRSRLEQSIQVTDAPDIATFSTVPGTKNWHGTVTNVDRQASVPSNSQPINESFELQLLNNITIVAKGDTFKFRLFSDNSYKFFNDYFIDHGGTIRSYKYIEYYPAGDSLHYKYQPYYSGSTYYYYDLVTP